MLNRLEVFDPVKTVFVLKPFKANGRQYATGEVFNWQRLSMTKRRVAQMFFTHQLSHGGVLPDEMKEYNPAKALLALGIEPESIAEFSKELVKQIHATEHMDELVELLAGVAASEIEQLLISAEASEEEQAEKTTKSKKGKK